ncbi:MAG: extracellular solute-binding protein [Chloroflexota bacterium]
MIHHRPGLLLVFVMLLAACGATDSTPTPAPVTPTVPVPSIVAIIPPSVTLQFWTVLPDRGVTEQSLNELTQAFQKEYPTIAIKVSSQPTYTDLYRKVVASIAAGTLPDLVTGLDGDLLQYARLRALVPLNDFIADPTDGISQSELADITPGLLETTRIAEQENRTYSLPFARGALALFYNWGVMKAIGITNTPRGWDEFRLHAKTLTKNPVRGFAYRSEAAVFDALLISRGGTLFNADFTKATFNSTAGTDTLSYLADGVKEGWIYRAEGASDMNDFAAGKTIFNLAPTTAIPVYQDAIAEAVKKGGKAVEWGVTPLPPAEVGKPSAVLVGSNIAILKSGEVKQRAAWLFLRWLLRDQTSALWTQVSGVLPARQSARAQLAVLFAKAPQQKQAINDLLPVARAEPNIRALSDIRDVIEGALAAFDSGKASPKAALDDAAAKANVLLGEGKSK